MAGSGSGESSAAEPRQSRRQRQRQIVAAFTRHGFGLLVQYIPVPLPGRSRLVGSPEGLRAALEELGPTFIKLGQILSTRPDLLPDDFIQALSSLQDQLSPIDTGVIRDVIQKELGAPPEDLYAWFDPKPFASASIGQVHLARLHSGQNVVVKVQKPGIDQQVELDLSIMHDMAHLAVERVDSPLVQNLDEIVLRFSDTLRDELDYVREGRNAERFTRQFGYNGDIKAPYIYWSLTTKRVLTMERIMGVKVNDLQALSALHVDRKQLARDLARMTIREIFAFGFFHADPHPGNYFVQPSGALGVIDFGMVGALDEGTRRGLVLLVAAWVQGDVDGLVDALFRLSMVQGGIEIGPLQADLRSLLGRYHDATLADIHLGQVLNDVFRIMRRHHVVLRGDLALVGKTLAMNEGLGVMLDPQFVLVTEVRPTVDATLRRLLLPHPDIYNAALNMQAFVDLGATFPQRAQRLLGQVERGEFTVQARLPQLDSMLHFAGHVINRVVLGLLVAASILGLSNLLNAASARSVGWLTFIISLALLATIALGLWLLLSMIRPARRR